MAGTELMEAFVKLRADNDALRKDLAGVQNLVQSRLSVGAQAAGVAVGSLIAAGIQGSIRAGLGAINFFGDTVRMASDAEESASKFGFVFKEAGAEVQSSLDAFAESAGRSRFELRAMSADVGALIGPMGFSSEKTGEMSVALVKLATDLSSFHNVSEKDAMQALRSGLVGETEPLRRFGVQLNEARLRSEALAMGLGSLKGPLSATDKAAAVMAVVMRDTAQAQGDAERTSDSYANSVRRLSAGFNDTKVAVGQALLPAMTQLVGTVTEIGAAFEGVATGASPVLKSAIEGLVGVFDQVSLSVADWENTWKLLYTSAALQLTRVADSAKWLWGQITSGATGIAKGFGASFGEIFDNWRGLVESMWEVFKAMAVGLGDALKEAFTGGGLDGMSEAFNAAIADAVANAQSEFGKVGGAFKGAFNAEMAQAPDGGPSTRAKALQSELDRIADARIQTRQDARDRREAAQQSQKAAAPGSAFDPSKLGKSSLAVPFFGEMDIKKPIENFSKMFGEAIGQAAALPQVAVQGAVAGLGAAVGSGQQQEQRTEFVGLAEMSKRIQSSLGPKNKPEEKTAKNTEGILSRLNKPIQVIMDRMPSATAV